MLIIETFGSTENDFIGWYNRRVEDIVGQTFVHQYFKWSAEQAESQFTLTSQYGR